MINQFVHDMIHMTEGEKLINYWELWSAMIVAVLIFVVYTKIKRK